MVIDEPAMWNLIPVAKQERVMCAAKAMCRSRDAEDDDLEHCGSCDTPEGGSCVAFGLYGHMALEVIEAMDRAEALTRTLPQSLMIPNAISAIKRQVDDRERDKLEGHLAGTYISLSPEQAKEIVQFFEHRGAHEGTAAMRRALRSARGWLNVIAQDRPDGSDIHRVLDDVDAALAAIAHTQ